MPGRVLRLALGRLFVLAVALACASSTFGYLQDQVPGWQSYLAFRAGLNSLERVRLSGATTDLMMSVPYRGATFSIIVPVDTGYLAAARRVDGSALFGTNPAVRRAALQALFAEQLRDPFVSAMSSRLCAVRASLRLSDDDYVDFVARAVQAIPYGTLHESTFMPVVTVAGNRGVCADKSVLLACLLAKAGYDTGVFVFPSQAHVTTAVRGRGPGLNGSGFSLVETTRFSYVGEVDGNLRAVGPMFRLPQLVTVRGTKCYSRDLQTEFIADTLERTRYPHHAVQALTAETDGEPTAKGALEPASQLPESRLANWIESRRDWPEATYAALAAAGPNR